MDLYLFLLSILAQRAKLFVSILMLTQFFLLPLSFVFDKAIFEEARRKYLI